MGHFQMGERIKEFRTKSGLSQEELASISGLSLRSVQRIEKNHTVPRGDSLRRISTALNISIESLTSEPTPGRKVTEIPPKQDTYSVLLLLLSAFGFLLHPLLGVLLPGIIWLIFRNTTSSVQGLGIKIIRWELIWCGVLAIVYGYILLIKFFGLRLPVPSNNKTFPVFITATYIINAFAIVMFAVSWLLNRPKSSEKPGAALL